VTEDWNFMSHHLPMARAARRAGYEVHVATRLDRHGKAIEAEGFHLHRIDLHRGSISPFKFAAAALAARKLYRDVAPALVHHIALQSSVIGSIAAVGLPVAQLNSIFGFGSVFTSNGPKARLTRLVLRPTLPLLFNARRSMTMVVNPDNRAMLIALGVTPERVVVVPGSGADVTHLVPLDEPAGPITAAYAGRMLEDKGVRSLVEAQQQLMTSGTPVNLLLAGNPDPANPNSIAQAELERWGKRPGITWAGHVADIREVWAKAHIAVLASHGEGLPMSLVEAAACARPLVATDVSGCREIARDGINALLVPVDDAGAIAAALARLAADGAMRQRFGAAGRRIVEQEFSRARVEEKIVAIYRQLGGTAGPG
jgi:glycosyltransferase involved in cell wall biosynthesis